MADEISYQLAHINQSRVPSLITSGAICLSAAYIAVVLRLISRRLVHARFEADDWCIVLGLVCCHYDTGIECLDIANHSHKLLDIHQCVHHQYFCAHSLWSWSPCSPYREAYRIYKGVYSIGSLYSLHLQQSLTVLARSKLVVADQIVYNPAVVAIKSSILLLYRRLFPGRHFHIVLWCVGGFVLSYSFAQSVVEVFECSPVNSLWNPQVKGKCINLSAELVASSVLNVVTDVFILVLPLPILWRLQISMERKLQLIGIFSLGGL